MEWFVVGVVVVIALVAFVITRRRAVEAEAHARAAATDPTKARDGGPDDDPTGPRG
ncbi:MAG: hypothetical protein QOH37_2497 [Nocardioidaceae bacterium]|jgi:hypothetical protein|nr:hypothetical protein [Nocardioidaceae bacterium]